MRGFRILDELDHFQIPERMRFLAVAFGLFRWRL